LRYFFLLNFFNTKIYITFQSYNFIDFEIIIVTGGLPCTWATKGRRR